MQPKRIGDLLLEKGALTRKQVEKTAEYGAQNGIRFGEAAIELGFLTPEKLMRVFGPNYRINFFYLNAGYFPKETQELFTREEILKYGALPLGFKNELRWFRKPRRLLNLGLLNPGDPSRIQELEKLAHGRIPGEGYSKAQVFLILTDQYLEVLRSVYGVGASELESKNEAELDPTLRLFLQT